MSGGGKEDVTKGLRVYKISKWIQKAGKTTTSSLPLTSIPLPNYSDLKIFDTF